MDFNAEGHLCPAFFPIYSERHQQNRTNGNTLQVRGRNEVAGRRRGGSFSEAHYSPHGVPSADPAVFQTPTLPLPSSCPSTPPPGEEVTHSHARPP